MACPAPFPKILAGLDRLNPDSDATVVLRSRDGVSLQQVVDVIGALQAAGRTQLVLVE